MNNSTLKPGSILLLTVMVIAVLTTTTLGAVAIRFDQLSSTDKINNSAVAKLAADSGLAKLKEKLELGTAVDPTIYDLDKNQESTGVDLTKYKPSPRSIVSSYEKASTALPRCLSVAVLSPWTNGGKYLFQDDDPSNPAMIFYYANIINDTPLGSIPENGSISAESDKLLPISELTKMGHFYNPYAPATEQQSYRGYWTIKMGGPEDEFLTRKNTDSSGSYYEGLDFLYIPYLPRWVDTALVTSGGSTTGVDRISANDIKTQFESTIRNNNFKVWLDASVKDNVLQEYGLGDLFTDSNEYRVSWLQPSLWNDLPEEDLGGAYKTDDINDTPNKPWVKKNRPVLTGSSGSNNWDVDIVRGSRPFSFVKLANSQNGVQLTPGATITGLLYGSMEGIRLNKKLSLTVLQRGQKTPLLLEQRSSDQGKLYEASVTEVSVAGNTTTVKIKLGPNSYHTPNKIGGSAITWGDLDSIVLTGNNAQFSTKISMSGLTINDNGNDGIDLSLNGSSSCTISATLSACPAVGDVVSLNKTGATPFWGQVKSVNFAGTSINGFTIDRARIYPKPVRHQAAVAYSTDGGVTPMIAYYGGEISMNDYDGGYNSESDELWLYNPEADQWIYPSQSTVTPPGRKAGSSLVYDEQNKRLVLFGGYYHEGVAVTDPPGQINCEVSQAYCLGTNQAGLRVAKRVTNDIYAYSLTGNSWEKINYNFDATKKIQNNDSYKVRVVSTLADRSGLERWRWQPRADATVPINLNVNGTDATTIKMSPSAAGLAVGDELYIFSRAPYFNAWARVTAVNYPNDTVTIVAHGNIRGAASIVLQELFMQVVTRQAAADTCTGSTAGGYYTCDLSGDGTGYAVGDQVVLEKYQAGKIDQVLSGYISHIKTDGTLYFAFDERRAELKDFRDNTDAASKFAGDSAMAFPVGRYGAAINIKPGDPQANKQVNYLFQGYSKNIATNIRFNEMWEAEFNNGVASGEASVAWGTKPKAMSNPAPSTNDDYNFKVIKPSFEAQIFTPQNGASAPEIAKVASTDPKTGAQTLSWNNTQPCIMNQSCWDLTIATSGGESIAPSRLVTGAYVTIERENGPDGPNPNVRETFHGIIVSTFTGSYDNTIIRLRHNPGNPNDSGLKTHSKNAKLSIFSYYRTDYAIYGGTDKIRWSSGGYLKLRNLSSDEVNKLPSSGMAVMFWRTIGNNDRIEAYTMTVKNKTYEAGVNEFRLYPDDQPYASPAPIAYGSNAVVSHNGNDAFALFLAEYQLSSYGQGAPEWYANAKDNNPLWQIRISDTDNGAQEVNDRPSPRQAGGFGSTYNKGSTKSQIFAVGGTYGRYADLWKMDHAGKMNGSEDIRWIIGKASPDGSKDLPNMFGGSLVLYEKDNLVKAVHFGGKLKFDGSTSDYGKYIGPRLLGEPQWETFSKPDNAYYLPDNSTVDAAGMVNTVFNNFTQTGDVGDTKNSFKLIPGGITSGNTKVCSYVGQDCQPGDNDSSPLLRHIGLLGRISDTNGTYGGYSWGSTKAVLNPGSAFRNQNADARMIMGASSYSASTTNGRSDQDGYYPYLCDTGNGCAGAPYGKTTTNYTSDKTMMIAGFTTFSGANQGGAILVTGAGIGTAIAAGRGGSNDASGRWYSYCSEYYYNDTGEGNDDFECKSNATRYLSWLPDPEDLVFMFNSTLTLSSTDTYKVVGYHGGAKRGYQVVKQFGRDPVVYEIVP
ncbi:MAG: hypothetical protein HZB70_03475 [Candidatus Berkelbacteria bacterium]|nr:MAG: hypothetical protein HZB70_03475 [Candidatus Berkelbacteria bacterium]QQG51637.1 MAG: hypothetical protein HY845_03715 [Candidatus Berkelbacteria bacterium]